MQDHINLLGLRVVDTVTRFEGVVTSVSFDLYGCIQAIVNPGVDKDGKTQDVHWFDVGRLRVLDSTPVLAQPDFMSITPATGMKGPEDKPMYGMKP